MTQGAAKTGAGPTATVAVEQQFPASQRILEDHLAYRILPLNMRVFVWWTRWNPVRNWVVRSMEQSAPGIWSGVLCRKRFIDDKIVEEIDKFRAVVNLGAGYDTRLFRLPPVADMPAWEVDLPSNLHTKRNRLRRIAAHLPARINWVPVDFEQEALPPALLSAGCPLHHPVFFIWEAVTQYLRESAVTATMDFLARAPAGSRLAFTYVRKDFIEGSRRYAQEEVYDRYVLHEQLWSFGLAPERIPDFLHGYGWRMAEHRGYEELAEQYVVPTGRRLASTAIERIVYAVKR